MIPASDSVSLPRCPYRDHPGNPSVIITSRHPTRAPPMWSTLENPQPQWLLLQSLASATPAVSTLRPHGLYPIQLQLSQQVTLSVQGSEKSLCNHFSFIFPARENFSIKSPGTTLVHTHFNVTCSAKVPSMQSIPERLRLYPTSVPSIPPGHPVCRESLNTLVYTHFSLSYLAKLSSVNKAPAPPQQVPMLVSVIMPEHPLFQEHKDLLTCTLSHL